MTTSNTTIQTADGPMPTFQVIPDGAPKGAIIVVQEAFGVNGHIQDLCRRFGREGFVAIAPALFHRNGSPIIAYDDIDSVMPQLGALTADGVTADLEASLSHLEAQGFT